MKVLVTGGAGFIGAAFVRYIINDTHDTVINADKLTYAGNFESLALVSGSDRYYFEQVDICDQEELDLVFNYRDPKFRKMEKVCNYMSRYEEVKWYLKNNQYIWVITGAAGFINSNLVESLVKLDQKVIGLDIFSTCYQHNID